MGTGVSRGTPKCWRWRHVRCHATAAARYAAWYQKNEPHGARLSWCTKLLQCCCIVVSTTLSTYVKFKRRALRKKSSPSFIEAAPQPRLTSLTHYFHFIVPPQRQQQCSLNAGRSFAGERSFFRLPSLTTHVKSQKTPVSRSSPCPTLQLYEHRVQRSHNGHTRACGVGVSG